VQHGHDADREVARDAAADLEEPDRALAVAQLLGGLRIPLGQPRHVFDAGAHGVHVLDLAGHDAAGIHVAEVASSQPGTMMGRFFSQAASIHEFFGSIW
jgi:3,4-dihydroxy-2-butanone 4-phosphate synthase